MARINVYFPDELAQQARAHNLPISTLAQQAVQSALTQLGDTPRGIKRMGPKLASEEQLQYLKDLFNKVHTEFEEKADAGVIRAIDTEPMLYRLQGLAKGLEEIRFAQLAANRDSLNV